MPRKSKDRSCQHQSLYIDCSTEALESGFSRPTPQRRLAAASLSSQIASGTNNAIASRCATDETAFNDGETFPGPLVLPDEALAIDPKEAPQSFRSWHATVRKRDIGIKKERNAIYVIAPPEVTDEVDRMTGWATPQVPKGEEMHGVPGNLALPGVDDLCDYLGAFYHGMKIKKFQPGFRWVSWSGEPRSKSRSRQTRDLIGLATPVPEQEVFGVRYRPSLDGVAEYQLNLDDILDAMIPRVPNDAHAVVMMLHQDLYEDEEDDFCCGRAYGGSRVCLVTSFRYHPSLDLYNEIDPEHMWPASHCRTYVDFLCDIRERVPSTRSSKAGSDLKDTEASSSVVRKTATTPLGAAVVASKGKLIPRSKAQYEGLWFSRTARTISHEIGHCVTLGHCVYFSCVMQGTASVAEDVRQPPYLCPVCVEKLSSNLAGLLQGHHQRGGGVTVDLQRRWIQAQHEALRDLCGRWRDVGMFLGLEAWLNRRLGSMEETALSEGRVPVQPNRDDVDFDIEVLPARTKKALSSAAFAEWLDEGRR